MQQTRMQFGSGCEVLWWVRLCVSVCLSLREDIPETTRAIFINFCACCLWLWLGPPPERWQNPKGKGAILGVFFPTDNTQYSIAFGTHTKMMETIKMPFGMTRGLGPRNSVLLGDDPRSGRAIFGENMCQTSLTPLWFANWTGPCSGVHMTGEDAWLQSLDESIIGCEGGIAHRGRSLISTTALFYNCFYAALRRNKSTTIIYWFLSHRKFIDSIKCQTEEDRNQKHDR